MLAPPLFSKNANSYVAPAVHILDMHTEQVFAASDWSLDEVIDEENHLGDF